jgi:hypothetical protein
MGTMLATARVIVALHGRRTRLGCTLVSGLLVLAACGGDPQQGPYVDECSGSAGATHAPIVSIRSPGSATAFEADEAIDWVVEVSDEDTELTELTLELLDYQSGAPQTVDLVVPGPDSSGQSQFTLPGGSLEAGLHPLHVRATDPDGCSANDDVLVCIDQTSCP